MKAQEALNAEKKESELRLAAASRKNEELLRKVRGQALTIEKLNEELKCEKEEQERLKDELK